MSVKIKTAKKIGLVTAISVLIGSVIGIGIFFKNNTIFQNNGNNATGVLISWILASIISLLTAFSFAEVGFNHRNGAGIGGASERMFGHKFGRFVSFNNSFFYFAILNMAVGVFAAESIIQIFTPSVNDLTEVMHIGLIMLIGFALMMFFIFFNFISTRLSGHFQIITTGLKFIPLLAVGLAGIIFSIMHPTNPNFFNPDTLKGTQYTIEPLSINGILSSIPAILFAYDSFLGVASLQGEMENPKKKVPLTIVVGMGICIFVYLFITIGQILVASGTAQGAFQNIFKDNQTARNVFSIIISVFIFISAIGCLNSLILVGMRTFAYSAKYRILYGYWKFDKHNTSDIKLGMIISFFVYAIWWLILLIPSCIINSDCIIDGVSNFPTLFMFAIYGTVVFKAWINRFTQKIQVNKMPGFLYVAPIATIGCYLAFGYQFFYYFSIGVFTQQVSIYHWGLFAAGPSFGGGLPATYGAIVFFLMVIIFITVPIINDGFLKLRYKRQNVNKLLINELLV